jgi:hypothetical protein
MQLGRVDGETIGSGLTPQQGFMPVGAPAPGGWTTAPSHLSAVAASVTVTSAATLDWSRYGVFQYLCTNGSNALALTFVNASVGQRIAIVIKQASSHTATTVTLSTGTVVGATTAATQSLTATDSAIDIIHVTCTAPGVYIATFN